MKLAGLENIKYWRFFLLLLLLSCSTNDDVSGEATETKPDLEIMAELKVMTYNIHLANPPSAGSLRDLDAIAKVINEAEPDLVALQEVDVFTERSGKEVNQAQKLAELTGMDFHFVKAMDVFGGGEYGVAVLSKHPISASKGYLLSADPSVGGENRALALIQVSLSNRKEILFAGTHLDHRSYKNRLHQAEKIQKILEGEELPVILAGDFNDVPNSETMDAFSSRFERTCKNVCMPTFSALNPKSAIDFILIRRGDNLRTVTHHVLQENYPSDHLPVIAGLRFN